MASIYTEIAINVAPAKVWAAVRNVGAVHRRLVMKQTLEGQAEQD